MRNSIDNPTMLPETLEIQSQKCAINKLRMKNSGWLLGLGFRGHTELFMLGSSSLFQVSLGPPISLTYVILEAADRPNINKQPKG